MDHYLNSHEPKIISLEGPESSGKTSVYNYLTMHLPDESFTFLPEMHRDFADHVQLGSRANLKTEIAMLFMTGAVMEVIQQQIDNGNKVITDRSWLTHIVYSMVRSNYRAGYEFDANYFLILEEVIRAVYRDYFDNLLLIYLHAPANLRASRRQHREQIFHQPDIGWYNIEHEVFSKQIARVSQRPLSVDVLSVDAAKPLETVCLEVLKLIEENM